MSYCSKCGSVIDSKFCINCGAAGNPTGGGVSPLAGGGNAFGSNLPANQMAMSHRRNFPQRNFFLWFVASIVVLPLAIINIYGGPLGLVASGIVYGIYTYFLMIDFTKYIEDMKQKDKKLSTIELPIESAWLFPLLIVSSYGLHFVYLIIGNIFDFNTAGAISFIIISAFYCVPGMTFLYIKHKMLEDITSQASAQELFNPPFRIKKSNLPLANIGILYACLFILLTVMIFILESDAQTITEFFGVGVTQTTGVSDIATDAPVGIIPFFVITGILLIALLCVWIYFEYQWHSSLYQLIKESHLSGILGDDDMAGDIISGLKHYHK